jgi:dephospho-CoA kinase
MKISKMRLGVTGGIGSGKTSVCRVFNVLGIPVFSADAEARVIMETDQRVISAIKSIAGQNIYRNGILNREELATLMFNNQEILKKVNHAVHPVVLKQFGKWEKLQVAPYLIMEAAILFESGAANLVDMILTVVAPFEERIDRVVKRNTLTREQVLERIKNQMDDEKKIRKSHYVIDNSDNMMIIPAILKIHEEIINILNNKA